MSPEPDTCTTKLVASIFKEISPDPDTAALKSLAAKVISELISPEPDNLTAAISVTGTSMEIDLFQELLRLILSFTFKTNTLFFTATSIYSKRFSSPFRIMSPSLP